MNARGIYLGLAVLTALALSNLGCAHRRQAYYPQEPGVRVRAPFVDVSVPTRRQPAVPVEGPGFGADQFAEPELDLD